MLNLFLYFKILPTFGTFLEDRPGSLQVENAYLQGRIAELDRQLRQMTNELRDFEDDHFRLQATYDIVAQENDDLRAEIGRLRLASQSSQSSLTRLEEESEERPQRKGKGRMIDTGEASEVC